MLQTIVDHTTFVLPDVSDLAMQGWHNLQQRSVHGLFKDFSVEERRDKEKEGRQLPGRCPKWAGHKGGRAGVRSVQH